MFCSKFFCKGNRQFMFIVWRVLGDHQVCPIPVNSPRFPLSAVKISSGLWHGSSWTNEYMMFQLGLKDRHLKFVPITDSVYASLSISNSFLPAHLSKTLPIQTTLSTCSFVFPSVRDTLYSDQSVSHFFPHICQWDFVFRQVSHFSSHFYHWLYIQNSQSFLPTYHFFQCNMSSNLLVSDSFLPMHL